MKDRANKRFWDKVAKFYTPLQEEKNKALYENLCRKIKPWLTPDQHVLELGAGTGQLTAILAGETATWIATDFSENMVKETKKRLNQPNLTFDVQDATKLTYNDNRFDLVLIANALHIMPDPSKALNEIRRVLKPNGLLIAPTFVYEGKTNRLKLAILEKIGFKTFHKWSADTYTVFIEDHGFTVKNRELIQGNLLPECLVVCGKA